MEYVHLGRSGLKVSRLCLGTMNFGPETDEVESHAIMDQALEEGINFFDTANTYGWKLGEGITEQIIGRWLDQGGGRRDQIVLATKVYGRMGESPNQRGLSAYQIRRACEGSLRRLRTDHIDLYQMHHIDPDTPWDEIWQAMEVLVQQGKVIYMGSSNFAAWNIAEAQCSAAARHFMGLVSEQSKYNLTVRMVELEVIPACRRFGLGILPWAPLAGGLLSGVLGNPSLGRRTLEEVKTNLEKCRSRIEMYESFCAELGIDPSTLALAWLLKNPVVAAPIIGPRTMDQLKHSLKSLDVNITGEILAKLDQIWPGPGGEAPKAYAW
jgi:aryl-alcohol dehydrogenase-like predicted oxidoreductase